MRVNKKIFASALAILAFACNNDGYIDPISSVPPGDDEGAPEVTINYPFEGAKIQVREDVVPINIQFIATDDIEVTSVVVKLDGTTIGELSDFKDYRKANESVLFENLTNGEHTVTVTATDAAGNTTTSTATFEKVEPYTPKYPGEIIYMPFDGDYLELLTITPGTPGGSPSFVDGLLGKAVRLEASGKEYVTFPGDTLAQVDEFSMSFWVRPEFVDTNGSGDIDGILGFINLSNTSGFWGNIDMFVENGSKPSSTKIVVHVTNDDSETWLTDAAGLTNIFGDWSHHVVTYSSADKHFKYYINNVLVWDKVASWSDALTFKNAGPIVMGAVHFMTEPSSTSGSGSQPWASYLTGEIDEVRIFDRAITEEEVGQIYDDIM